MIPQRTIAKQLHDPAERQQNQAPLFCQSLSKETAIDPEAEILARLASIEAKLDAISQEKTVFEFYSVEEFAKRVNRSNFCVRNWARLGRVNATKRNCGRGRSPEWCISHEELIRYFNHGLLPDPRRQK